MCLAFCPSVALSPMNLQPIPLPVHVLHHSKHQKISLTSLLVFTPFSQQYVTLQDSISLIGFGLGRIIEDLKQTAIKTNTSQSTMFPSVYSFLESLGLDLASQSLVASKKISFPFEKINSFAYLRNCTSVPPLEHFSSLLRGDETGNLNEYTNFTEVWRALNAENMLDMFHIYIGTVFTVFAS